MERPLEVLEKSLNFTQSCLYEPCVGMHYGLVKSRACDCVHGLVKPFVWHYRVFFGWLSPMCEMVEIHGLVLLSVCDCGLYLGWLSPMGGAVVVHGVVWPY